MSVETGPAALSAPRLDASAVLRFLAPGPELSGRALDLQEFVQRHCDGIRELTGSNAAAIVLRDLVCVSGMEDQEAARHNSAFAHRERLRETWLAAEPIPLPDEPGCVYLFNPGAFGDETELLLRTIAGQMALVCDGRGVEGAVEELRSQLAAEVEERRATEQALQQSNEKLTEWVYELEQRNRDMALLKEITDLIQACLSTKEADLVISEYLPRLFEANSGAICVLDPAGQFVETVASWGDTEGLEKVFLPEHCWSLRRARPHCVKQPQTALRCSHVGGLLAGWYVCVPLIAHGQALGLLHVNSKTGREGEPPKESAGSTEPGLTPAKQQLAETVAEQLGMALANLQLREALRTQAVRDPLTGLFNRRYMEESLTREVRRATRAGSSFGCIMMDLDHFKKFNDTYGHGAGDMLLRQVGAYLLNQLRSSDIVCRYGGEEFTVILPDASLDITGRRAEEIRIGVSNIKLEHHPDDPSPTVSLGVAALPDHGLDADSVLRTADRALYRAKSEGRNRVCVGGN